MEKESIPHRLQITNFLTKLLFYFFSAPLNVLFIKSRASLLTKSTKPKCCKKKHTHIAVLVLVFVVYNRRRESHIKYPGPDDDVRENIINYDDEGGGEDDMTAFDITPLQIPIGGPMPELSNCKMPIMCKLLLLFIAYILYHGYYV